MNKWFKIHKETKETSMYPEYKKVKSCAEEANLLLNTSRTMEDIFVLSTKRNLKRIAVTYTNNEGKLKKYKYSRFRKHAFEIASILSNFMIQQPKNVPIVLKANNGPHWGEIFWAILMTGYKPLLVDAKTSKEGTENLIKQGKAIAIITDDNNTYDVPKFSLRDLLQEKHSYEFAPNWENEVIFCSSGTTGDVKLMVFNGENLCHQILAALDFAETSKDLLYPKSMGPLKVLAMIPFHHIFGFIATFLWYFYYGANFVFVRNLAPSEVQSVCQKCKVTHVFSVPLFWDSLAQGLERKKALETPTRQQYIDKLIGYNTGKILKEEAGPVKMVQNTIQKKLLGNKIRFCISGGGYLDSKTQTVINGVGYPLYNGYGMTEIGITSVELSPIVELRLKGSIGIPLHGVSYKIKPTNGKGRTGELLVKSDITHIREIIGGVERETQLDKDGYFSTGDIAEVDATNRYYLKGRMKDVIINADGENIFPDELEIFFKKIPHIQAVCVLGVDQKGTKNQRIVCAVEIDNSISSDEIDVLKEEVKKAGLNLPKGTKITEFYFARNKLPIANNMKVKRFVVKKSIETMNGDYIPFDFKKEVKGNKNFSKETMEKVVEPLRKIFSKILILPEFKIDDDAHWIDALGGDSMSYVELITTVQDQFKVTIPETSYGKLTCINDFAEEIVSLQKNKK